jgi:HK97 family phage major capsid protein
LQRKPEADPTSSGFTSYVDTLGFSTKVSNQLLQDSAFSVDDFLSQTISAAWTATASEAIINDNRSKFQSIATDAAVGSASSLPSREHQWSALQAILAPIL